MEDITTKNRCYGVSHNDSSPKDTSHNDVSHNDISHNATLVITDVIHNYTTHNNKVTATLLIIVKVKNTIQRQLV